MPNRLLDLFQSEVHKGRAPSHGANNTNNADPESPEPKIFQGGTKCLSTLGIFGSTATTGARLRVETTLERENAHLREQLKFQGAVLDRLAVDVHKLETEAAAANGTALNVRSSSIHNQDGKDDKTGTSNACQGVEDEVQTDAMLEGHEEVKRWRQDVSEEYEHAPVGGPSEYDQGSPPSSDTRRRGRDGGQVVRETEPELLRTSIPDHLQSSDEECSSEIEVARTTLTYCTNEASDDNGQLRSELREARKLVEASREGLVSVHKTAEDKEQSHLDLLSRERKFRAAVEAGLREKIHNMRSRARDREERILSQFSSVRSQLKETVDLLAIKAEEEDEAAAALAKGKERDRHARWLERRLKEVSSEEENAVALRMEAMTATLEAQQLELEALRASAREATKSRELEQNQQQETDPPEVTKRGTLDQYQANPGNRVCSTEGSFHPLQGKCPDCLSEGSTLPPENLDKASYPNKCGGDKSCFCNDTKGRGRLWAMVSPHATAVDDPTLHMVSGAPERETTVLDAVTNAIPTQGMSSSCTSEANQAEGRKTRTSGTFEGNNPPPESSSCEASNDSRVLSSRGVPEACLAPTRNPGQLPWRCTGGSSAEVAVESVARRETEAHSRQEAGDGQHEISRRGSKLKKVSSSWKYLYGDGGNTVADPPLVAESSRRKASAINNNAGAKTSTAVAVSKIRTGVSVSSLATGYYPGEADDDVSRSSAVVAPERQESPHADVSVRICRDEKRATGSGQERDRNLEATSDALLERQAAPGEREYDVSLDRGEQSEIGRIRDGEIRQAQEPERGQRDVQEEQRRQGEVDRAQQQRLKRGRQGWGQGQFGLDRRRQGLEPGRLVEREEHKKHELQLDEHHRPREESELGRQQQRTECDDQSDLQRKPADIALARRKLEQQRRELDLNRGQLEQEREVLERKHRDRLEQETHQGIEDERRRLYLDRKALERERQALERERRESSEAVEEAERRVEEVEAAWEALAGKIVRLANRNAALESALLKLQRDSRSTAATYSLCDHAIKSDQASRTSPPEGSMSSNDTDEHENGKQSSISNNGGGGDGAGMGLEDRPITVWDGAPYAGHERRVGRRRGGATCNGTPQNRENYDEIDVPRASLNFEALIVH